MPTGGIISLIEQGGVVIYPLLFCSIVALTIIIERTWTLARGARGAQRLRQFVDDSLSDGSLAEAVALSRRDTSPMAPVYRAVLSCNDAGARERLAQRRLTGATRQMKRFVWVLGTIGSLAPFIGLFGTVVGIIRAFENMAATGSGGFAVVAAGISEALVATAGGLLVGVLSLFAYNAFTVRINALAAEFREQTEEILERMAESPVAHGSVPRAVKSA